MSEQVLYFAHSNGFTMPVYQALLEPLSAHVRIEGITKLAHSPSFPIDHQYRGITDELIADMRAKGIQGAIGVGHSLGALLIFQAACRCPELFRYIILMDPPLALGAYAFALRSAKRLNMVDRLTPARQSSRRRTQFRDRAEVWAYLQKRPFFQRLHARCLADYANHGFVDTPQGIELAFSANIETQLFRHLPTHFDGFAGQLSVPGLLMRERRGSVCRPSNAERFLSQHDTLADLEVDFGDHMFPLQAPQQTAALILKQLTQA